MPHKGSYKGSKVPKSKRGTKEGHMMAEKEMKGMMKKRHK